MTEKRNNASNVPTLRFPGFYGEWKRIRIGDLLVIGSGKDYKHLQTGNIPVFGTGGYMTSVNKCLHDGETVCIGRKGTINKPFYYNGKIWTVDTLFYTHSFKNIIPRFCFNLFEKINWLQFNEASGVPSLSKSTIENIEVYLPEESEQKKIAAFLNKIEQRIETQNKIIEELESLVKGLRDRFFNQLIFFKKDGNQDLSNWKKKKLGEICLEHQLKNSHNKFNEVFSVSKHKGVINQIEHLGRSFSAKEIDHYKLIYPGDLVYTKSPTSEFPFGIIKQNRTGRIGVVSPLYCVFRPETYALGYLLHEYFNSAVNTYNYLNPLVQKGAKNTMNINNNDFLNGAKLLLPMDKDEQNKIVNVLISVDEKINNEKNILDHNLKLKEYLLANLFK